MRLFRLKDKKQYCNAKHSVFTASFTSKLVKFKQDNDKDELKNTIDKIIRKPINKYLGIDHSLSQREK